jgi:hypothetical protein
LFGRPFVGYDLNNVAYAGGLQDYTSLLISFSMDNGGHWSPALFAAGDPEGMDSPWLQIDTNLDSPFKNTLFLSWIRFPAYFSAYTQVAVSHSADGAHTWSTTSVDLVQAFPSSIDLFSHLSVGTDGALYVTWLRCRGTGPIDCGDQTAAIMFSRSTDGGNTWSLPLTIAKVALAAKGNACIYRQGCLPNTLAPVSNIPANAVFGNGATAKVYVVFYNWTGTQMQVEVATSTDGGNTFSSPVRVTNANNGDEFFAWISLSGGGTIGVTWLDRRNDPSNISYQPLFATSADGAEFSPARPLSTTLSNPDNNYFRGLYLGVYRTHVWVGNAIYATWMDTRSGTARIELGGVQF